LSAAIGRNASKPEWTATPKSQSIAQGCSASSKEFQPQINADQRRLKSREVVGVHHRRPE
jgi:hypothetical protein